MSGTPVIPVELHPFGEAAVLVEVASLPEVLALHARLVASRASGVIDLVPAARTILVRVDRRVVSIDAARRWIVRTAEAEAQVDAAPPSRVVELPIRYDGEDLASVANLLGFSPDALAARHAAATWTVAFTGFAPGFGYLVSEDWALDVPRRDSPRTRVPAGSVGLAGEFSGAYPRETPGGWQLIGTTSATLFDPSASAPALLTPGASVRFRPVRAVAAPSSAAPPAPVYDRAALQVIEPGLQATVQDQGRPGRAAEGIATSGAADRASLRTALRLVGTAEDAAGIEIVFGGFRARALADLWFAVTGAWGPITVDGRPVDPFAAHPWPAGTELHIGPFVHGIRGYLAIRGGVEGAQVVGSRATDTLAGLGPAPLRAGAEVVQAEDAVGAIPPEDLHPWSGPADEVIEVAVAPGPRAAWFSPGARAALFDAVWTVSGEADRVGIRLDGPLLDRVRTGELPSEGMVPGAIQVPPSGTPVILGPDGPVTGGYPVIAVVTDDTRDLLGQARPGTRIRFRHAR